MPKFASLGVFAQLDGKMPNFDALAQATYPGSLSTNKWQGHYYGLPLDTNTRVLISNQQALTAAGISSPPATFADLQADAPKLAAKKCRVFADSGLQGWNILPWIWSGGGEITDPNLTKATGYLNGPQTVTTVQMLVNLYKQGAIPNLLVGNKGAVQTQDGLPKANYADILDGPWMQGIWQAQYASFKPTYTPVPAGGGGSISVVGGEDIVMTSEFAAPGGRGAVHRVHPEPGYQLAMAKTGQMSVVSADDAQEARRVAGACPVHQATSHGEVPASRAGRATDRHRLAGRSGARVRGQDHRPSRSRQGCPRDRSIAHRHEVRMR